MKTLKMLLAILMVILGFSVWSFSQNGAVLHDRHGKVIHLFRDSTRGTVKGIEGFDEHIKYFGLTPGQLTNQSVESIVKELLDAYSKFTSIASKDVRKIRIKWLNGAWAVSFQQLVGGIPVENSAVGFMIGPQGKIVLTGLRTYSNIRCSLTPAIDSNDAIKLVEQDFDRKDVRYNPAAVLVILPLQEKGGLAYRLAWKVTPYSEKPDLKSFIYYVDAEDGRFLRKDDQVTEVAPTRRNQRLGRDFHPNDREISLRSDQLRLRQ